MFVARRTLPCLTLGIHFPVFCSITTKDSLCARSTWPGLRIFPHSPMEPSPHQVWAYHTLCTNNGSQNGIDNVSTAPHLTCRSRFSGAEFLHLHDLFVELNEVFYTDRLECS